MHIYISTPSTTNKQKQHTQSPTCYDTIMSVPAYNLYLGRNINNIPLPIPPPPPAAGSDKRYPKKQRESTYSHNFSNTSYTSNIYMQKKSSLYVLHNNIMSSSSPPSHSLPSSHTKLFYDYIIVGAGSSGCVLANRLTQDPNIRVLLIEVSDV